jgi:nickel-dependent lactate racemase
MVETIQLPFRNEELTVKVPRKNLAWVVSPRDIPGVSDPQAEVRRALKAPIGQETLPELVKKHGRRVVLLVDDMTRSTPQRLILPVLLDELNQAGVADRDITAIICLGTHRPMSEAEIAGRYGAEAVSRIRFINHDCRDEPNLVAVKNPNSATPILVNRLYYESDLSIAVGNIIPHMYAGWAGGAKMVQPGVCGEATTGETHYLAAENVHRILGNIDNPVRREIENVAALTGLKMIVNTVLNMNHEIVRVVAGDPTAAHRAGVEIGKEVYEIEIEDYCDLVIASASPADLDFWQSIKAMNNCGLAVRPGGTLILAAADPEGIAPDHPDLVRLGTCSAADAKAAFEAGIIRDKVGLATYLAMNLNRNRIKTTLISRGIAASAAAAIGLGWAPTLEQALNMALREYGDNCRIGVVTQGADIYFRVKPSASPNLNR